VASLNYFGPPGIDENRLSVDVEARQPELSYLESAESVFAVDDKNLVTPSQLALCTVYVF